jgi:iron donor protein CyaY
MDDQDFQQNVDHSLTKLYKALIGAADDYNFEVDFSEGALTIEFDEPPARFVVSPNSPVQQIWVSANVKSYKLGWDEVAHDFVLHATGQTLQSLVEEAIGRHLNQDVNL